MKSFVTSVIATVPGFIDSPTLRYGIVNVDADKNRNFSIVFLSDATRLFPGSYAFL